MIEESIAFIKEFLNTNSLLTDLLIEDINDEELIKVLHKYVINYTYISDVEIDLIDDINIIYDINTDINELNTNYLKLFFKQKFFLYKEINMFSNVKRNDLLNDLKVLVEIDIKSSNFELNHNKNLALNNYEFFNYLYEKKPFGLWLINGAYTVLGHIIAAVIICVWR